MTDITAPAIGEAVAAPTLAELATQLDNAHNGVTPPPDEAPAETERLAAKYAEAARRNQALRAKQREIKAPLIEKDSEIEKYKAEVERLKKYEDVTDPMELLKLKGMSYEDLINRNLDPEAFDSKAEIQKMREELENYKKASEEKEKTLLQKQTEEIKSGYLAHVKKFTESQPEKYELINSLGHHKDVYEVIEETYNRTGKVISDEEAADLVERYLEAEAQKQLDHFSKLSKLKSKFAPITEETQQRDPYSESPTLSNQLAAPTSAKNEKLSEEETLRRAAAFIKWT
jgi:hypothetical protein